MYKYTMSPEKFHINTESGKKNVICLVGDHDPYGCRISDPSKHVKKYIYDYKRQGIVGAVIRQFDDYVIKWSDLWKPTKLLQWALHPMRHHHDKLDGARGALIYNNLTIHELFGMLVKLEKAIPYDGTARRCIGRCKAMVWNTMNGELKNYSYKHKFLDIEPVASDNKKAVSANGHQKNTKDTDESTLLVLQTKSDQNNNEVVGKDVESSKDSVKYSCCCSRLWARFWSPSQQNLDEANADQQDIAELSNLSL